MMHIGRRKISFSSYYDAHIKEERMASFCSCYDPHREERKASFSFYYDAHIGKRKRPPLAPI